jgi:hypothetical protein
VDGADELIPHPPSQKKTYTQGYAMADATSIKIAYNSVRRNTNLTDQGTGTHH